jgi:Protein of unknown function (DUF3179)
MMEEIELSSVDEFEQGRLAINKIFAKLFRFLLVNAILFGSVYWYKNKIHYDEIAFHQNEKDKVLAAYVTKLEKEARKEQAIKGGRRDNFAFDSTNLLISRIDIYYGGIPKNGIEALVNPPMVSPLKAHYLRDDDEIAGLTIDGESHAFPLRILNYHEVINTKIGNQSVAITYCPLCKSLMAYDRIKNDKELTFWVSGRLYNSNVLFYTQGLRDDPLYSQIMNKQISGEHSGSKMKILPVELTSWKNWKKRYPETKVLSARTGHSKKYYVDPYSEYFNTDRLMFPVMEQDGRLPLKSLVLGIWSGDIYRAFPLKEFEKEGKSKEIKVTINNRNVTIYYDHDSKSLRVNKADKDVSWMYSFWFAWYAFHPETELYSLAGE